jgi:hypothetical protein
MTVGELISESELGYKEDMFREIQSSAKEEYK